MPRHMSHTKTQVLAVLSLITVSSLAQAAPARPQQQAPTDGKSWVLSGFLPDEPGRKAYVLIEGTRIVSVSATAPQVPAGTLRVDTNDLIFPGLVDMHSHVKYNVLGLWGLAKGQFLNRFEWRQKFPAYKDAVSFNMKAIKEGTGICSAVRWAEVKAITGGATALQGIGGDAKCAKGYGVHNLEIPGEFENTQRVRASTDLIMPGLMASVFEPMIAPQMTGGRTYDQAFVRMLQQQGVTGWVRDFQQEEHNLGSGLALLLGPEAAEELGLARAQSSLTGPADARRRFTQLESQIAELLGAAPFELNANAAAKQITNMKIWLFGAAAAADEANGGYLRAASNEIQAYDYLSKGGVMAVASSVRRYIGMFERSIRQSAFSYFSLPDALGLVAHLSEGRRDDAYNRQEFQYAKRLGLVRSGLVMIHAVGLNATDLAYAAREKASVVWSPFSNLLLYGETLDVGAAKAAGVNLAIGADWSPTGSKNILDELKIAKRYIKSARIRGINDKDLVEMATINAARAIRRDQVIGRVAGGFQADILLVKKPRGTTTAAKAYTALVESKQADVNLVVVGGQPLYGEPDHVQAASRYFSDSERPESLPRGRSCTFRKAIRLAVGGASGADTVSPEVVRIADVEKDLKDRFAAYRDQVTERGNAREIGALASKVDPIYSCEDAEYTARFDRFVEEELAENTARLADVRSQYQLLDTWSPLSTSGDDDDVTQE